VSKINSIKVKQLSKIFETKNGGFEALSEVNLEVKKGDFISIIGPSGCGKTTLMRCLSNLEDASNGFIEINGKTPDVARKDRDFGMVFQSSGLLSWRNSIDNVMLPVELSGKDTNSYKNKVNELLELVSLVGFEKSYPHELSGGMQQRVSIARSLILEPQILFMDEPFGALDHITREKLNIELLNIWEKRKQTIIFITHNIREAIFLSDQIVVMESNPGKIKKILNVDFSRPRSDELKIHPKFKELELEGETLLKS
tara:strand:- start:6791 stop:7558 length:768 start_codon:yes stop_codon:yes gene_type:complete